MSIKLKPVRKRAESVTANRSSLRTGEAAPLLASPTKEYTTLEPLTTSWSAYIPSGRVLQRAACLTAKAFGVGRKVQEHSDHRGQSLKSFTLLQKITQGTTLRISYHLRMGHLRIQPASVVWEWYRPGTSDDEASSPCIRAAVSTRLPPIVLTS